jgi:hypothetical protein
MTTIRKSHRQEEVTELPSTPEASPEYPSEPTAPADQFQKYRDAAVQLESFLKNLDALEDDIAHVKLELERTEALLEVAYDAPTADFNEIDRLTLRRNSISMRLERMGARLLAAQHDVQELLYAIGNDLNGVYQITRNALIARATDEVCALLHPSARGLQRINVQTVAIFHEKVVDAAELWPSLHPMATQPLEDIEGGRQWSLEGADTVRVMKQECARILAALPKLLAVAAQVSPPAGEAVTVAASQ